MTKLHISFFFSWQTKEIYIYLFYFLALWLMKFVTSLCEWWQTLWFLKKLKLNDSKNSTKYKKYLQGKIISGLMNFMGFRKLKFIIYPSFCTDFRIFNFITALPYFILHFQKCWQLGKRSSPMWNSAELQLRKCLLFLSPLPHP